MDELLKDFLVEANESLDSVDVQLVRFEQEPSNQEILRGIFRMVHSIKGTCGFLGLPRLEALTHAAEAVMSRFRDQGAEVTSEAVSLILATIDRVKMILAELDRAQREPPGTDEDLITRLRSLDSATAVEAVERLPAGDEDAFAASASAAPAGEPALHVDDPLRRLQPDTAAGANTLRVSVDTLERLLTMVSELVLTRNQLLEIARQKQEPSLNVPLQRLSHVTAELQECVMKTRMQPIGHAWQKLPRLVRDLAKELRKDIALVLDGVDTELDRQVLDLIKDPLTHMVRNACDHGLERPEDRILAGKPPRATISLSAYHAGGTITIEVADDGRGLDFERIRSKARQRGLLSEAESERASDAHLANLIFHPGFSTVDQVTAISGRGVGLDVVQSNIEIIGGAIEVRSTPGRGTLFSIRLPLTLAIVPALLVGVGEHRFALPQTAVNELVRIGSGNGSTARVETIDDQTVLVLRGQLLPLVPLARVFEIEGAYQGTDRGFVVVLGVGSRRYAVIVDAVFHTEEIVVKPMSSQLGHLAVFSGNTILGDGAVVLIIEPNGLARLIGVVDDGDNAARQAPLPEAEPVKDEPAAVSTLLYRAAGRLGGVPLSTVARLEDIAVERIEQHGDRLLTHFRDRLMPLIDLGEPGSGGMLRPCLVVAYGDTLVGLLVDEIVDVVDKGYALDLTMARRGTLGSAILDDVTVEILDTAYYLRQIAPDFSESAPVRDAGQANAVLLVDDSAFFRDVLLPVLRGAGYQVSVAGSGNSALSALQARSDWAAVMVDRDLVDMPGFVVADAARHHAGAGCRIVLLSSALGAADRVRAAECGVDEVVSKFDRDGLLLAIRARMREQAVAA